LLLSPDVAARLKTADVSKWVRGQAHASDHAPTWIELGAVKRKRSSSCIEDRLITSGSSRRS
jgi:exodeoxyribonuclease III